MSGKNLRVLFDTDVLIWYFRGLETAAELIAMTPFEQRSVSSICIMELTQGCRNKKELREINAFTKGTFSSVIHCDKAISEKAIALLRSHALSHGLGTVDALVAASALLNDATLATGNFRHFDKIANLNLLKFDPRRLGT
jgi:predicted nucleic acid-binding protein